MQTKFLQSMLATNAKAITAKEATIAACINEARMQRASCNKAFMVEEFNNAQKARKQLAKLVATQRAMLAELEANYREARIKQKASKLEAMGVEVTKKLHLSGAKAEDLTGPEIEAMLDQTLKQMKNAA